MFGGGGGRDNPLCAELGCEGVCGRGPWTCGGYSRRGELLGCLWKEIVESRGGYCV